MFNQFNHVRYTDWGKNTEGYEYHNLGYLREGVTYRVYGFFITPDRGYGKGVVAIVDGAFINLPQRYIDIVGDILAEEGYISDIIAGHCGIRYTKYISKRFNREAYNLEFCDI